MTIRSFINLAKKEAGTLAFILAVLLTITAIITFIQPLRYEASNKLLIQQDVSKFNPYNIYKINEYYNNLIKEIVHSESFFKQALNSGYDINPDYFKDTRKEQIKTWGKTVDIVSTDIGTMKIKAYHPNPKEAQQILLAVTDVLVNKNSQYQNLDNNVDIKIINQITISKYPVKPNIILNFIYTIIIAIVISLLYLYYVSEKQYHGLDKDSDDDYNNRIKKNDENTEKQTESEALANNVKQNNEDNLKTEEHYDEEIKDDSPNNNTDKENNLTGNTYTEDRYNIENNFNENINNNEKENNDDNEKTIQEGEEVNLEQEIEEDADINNLFSK